MKSKNIYLVGICGTAMGALAAMLQEQGHRVSGSDTGIYPPISEFLAARSIQIIQGYRAENIRRAKPDLVVIGNVIRADNPEAVEVRESGLDRISLPEALERLFLPGKQSIVAAGTHGKTTCTALMAWLLERAGLEPSFMLGGLALNFNGGSNYKLGQGPYFVIEGDEYDTAFFDKGAKFFHYRPEKVILTGAEFDHADIFPSLAAIESTFARFIDLVPNDGLIMVNYHDNRARRLTAGSGCEVLTYGFETGADVRAEKIRLGPGRVGFEMISRGRSLGEFSSPLAGRHNLMNSLACLGLCIEMGISPNILKKGLAAFRGVKRRQEVMARLGRGDSEVVVIDDFAHHPTAVRETLAALKDFYAGRRLVAAFEPRTATSVRNIFQAEYAASFGAADLAIIKEAFRKPGVAEEERFSSARLVEELSAQGLAAVHAPDTDRVLAVLLERIKPGDVVVIMSNGGFDGLHSRLKRALARATRGPRERA